MSVTSPIILWFRRDLRLSDHPALDAACATGRPVIPVFLLDDLAEGLGAAPKWRLGLGLQSHARALEDKRSRLVLRRGDALATLRDLVAETGAGAVWWTRVYDPDSRERDARVKQALKEDGIAARSFGGHLMFEPWTVTTGQGGMYRVYTPFWNAEGQDNPPASARSYFDATPKAGDVAARQLPAGGCRRRTGASAPCTPMKTGPSGPIVNEFLA